jgi:hypothetical protein
VLARNVLDGARLERQREYLRTAGSRYRTLRDGKRVAKQQLFRLMHAAAG